MTGYVGLTPHLVLDLADRFEAAADAGEEAAALASAALGVAELASDVPARIADRSRRLRREAAALRARAALAAGFRIAVPQLPGVLWPKLLPGTSANETGHAAPAPWPTQRGAGVAPLTLGRVGSADRGGLVDEVVDGLLGEFVSFWPAAQDGLSTGSTVTKATRILRTGIFLNALRHADRVDPMLKFPTFNTGLVGRGVAWGMERVPALASTGRWLASPAATTAFRRLGVVGGVVGTGMGVHGLVEQGNPVDAYRREGAGYVADVASTAFSASTTAFMVAPNPVTGALVVGSGLVWAGAEVVDHWDDVSEWGSEALDWTGERMAQAWEMQTAPIRLAADAATTVASGVADVAGDAVDAVGNAWDAGTDRLGDIGGGLVDAVSDWF